jgi:hypothetical protein
MRSRVTKQRSPSDHHHDSQRSVLAPFPYIDAAQCLFPSLPLSPSPKSGTSHLALVCMACLAARPCSHCTVSAYQPRPTPTCVNHQIEPSFECAPKSPVPSPVLAQRQRIPTVPRDEWPYDHPFTPPLSSLVPTNTVPVSSALLSLLWILVVALNLLTATVDKVGQLLPLLMAHPVCSSHSSLQTMVSTKNDSRGDRDTRPCSDEGGVCTTAHFLVQCTNVRAFLAGFVST